MFDIGFWELVLLFGMGLLILGPEKLPKVAANIGKWVGQARRMASQLSSQIRDEIEPINKAMNTDFSARRPEPGKENSSSNIDSENQDS
ncbi:MAG: Sec-independent protein translocase protein TatB [Pseudomonadota bacterium]|nr:Sec-independent protein translocase protein TatB [Pseudomonadota bacterium]